MSSSPLSNIALISYLNQHGRRRYYLYSIILALLNAVVIALPFIFLDVSVNCDGMLRSVTEPHVIRSRSSGFIQSVYIRENSAVRKGDILLTMRSTGQEQREINLRQRSRDTEDQLQDVHHLIKQLNQRAPVNETLLSSQLYRRSLADYEQQVNELTIRVNKTTLDFRRNKILFDEGVIAASDMENYKFEMDKALSDLRRAHEYQLKLWVKESEQLTETLAIVLEQLTAVGNEKMSMDIIAPVRGVVQQLTGIYEGSFITANQELGVISPDTLLVAEAFVDPKDIGLLRPAMNARIQVTAFNHNQWGLLDGSVSEISDDVRIVNGKPFFEVRCKLSRDFMKLKDGQVGSLKKGMTVQVRFDVTRRSIWQLLFDQVDDWINPNSTY